MEQSREIISAKSFINNEWIGHSTTNILTVKNKYDQVVIATIPLADSSEVQFAISNSVQGFQTISKMSAEDRKNMLLNLRDGLMHEKEKFINLIVTEAGKPTDYARLEVERSIFILEYAAHEAIRFTGETVPMDFGAGTSKTAFTKRFPIGPILAFSPFNFPLNLAIHKIAPAIAAGNSVILKPSPYTPLTALALGALAKRVGIPAGVLNIVVCSNEEAQKMLLDPRLKYLSFTGSADVGFKLKSLADRKKVTLELGGNAAVIVDRSSNIDEAVKAITRGAYIFAGQVCISIQRIYVDSGIFDQFVEKMKVAMSEIKWGNPHEEGVILGPVIDPVHLERIHAWVMEAKNMGADIIAGGDFLDREHLIYAPTLLTNTNRTMKVNSEEIFGPVAVIEKVEYFDEVINEINSSRYGLQAGLYTNQLSQIKYAHENLEVGALIINNIPGFRVDSMPYGGVKDSGVGREGIKYVMEEMTEPRMLVY